MQIYKTKKITDILGNIQQTSWLFYGVIQYNIMFHTSSQRQSQK